MSGGARAFTRGRGAWLPLAVATACAVAPGPFIAKVLLPTAAAWARPLGQPPAVAPAVAGLAEALGTQAVRAGVARGSPLDLSAYLAPFQPLLSPAPA